MKKNIVFFEVEGGSDKGSDGHRKDTMPMVNALKEKGWNAEVIYYSDKKGIEIFQHVLNKADAYVSRINPGNIPGGEASYFQMLRYLNAAGVVGMPHPDAMLNYGAKDALCKITDTGLVPEDTLSYYTVESLKEKFPVTLSLGQRVLKQNRGSTGEGIWRVEVVDEREFEKGKALPLDTKIKCTEAVDNHVEIHELGEFMNFCEQYIVGENGMLVDMRFLPRIKEGEIRILMIGDKPIFVVHKKPQEAADAFSATLFSGAKYTYSQPSEWQELVNMFLAKLPIVMHKLGGYEEPLIWTADFMLDWDEDGNDKYVLGEINCSCVGFTSHLDCGIQEAIADRIISVVTAHKASQNSVVHAKEAVTAGV
jgi:glutathione synthase/RimK-type ligase-like ATP-grasp enzyme